MPRSRSRSTPGRERVGGDLLAAVLEPQPLEPELGPATAARGSRSSSAATRASLSAAPSSATAAVHGSIASLDETPAATRLSAALRCPSAVAYSPGSRRGQEEPRRRPGRRTRGEQRARP